MSNRVTLNDLSGLTADDVSALPPDQIAILLDELAGWQAQLRVLSDRLSDGIAIRYGGKADARRRATQHDTGTVTLMDGDYDVKCNLPKKVTWDQVALAALADVPAARKFIRSTYTVPEATYAKAPDDIRAILTTARTVSAGTPTYKLIKRETA